MIATLVLSATLRVAAAEPAFMFAEGVPTERGPAGASAEQPAPFRTDEIVLTLDPMSAQEGSELEYMVRLPAGGTLVYAWSVEGPAKDEDFYTEFHGHTPPGDGFKVAVFRDAEGRAANGSLTAPFDGTYGWFFQNRSMAKARLKLRLAGFYELRSIRETLLEEGSDAMPFGPPRPAAR